MSTPMSEERLAEIRKRVEAATPGPWDTYGHRHGTQGCRCLSCYDEPTGWLLDHKHALSCEERAAVADDDNRYGTSCDEGPLLSYEDADFAAHARADVPALLDEVERLRRQLSGVGQGERSPGLSTFWTDLNRHLRNPKFRRSYVKESLRIQAFDDQMNADPGDGAQAPAQPLSDPGRPSARPSRPEALCGPFPACLVDPGRTRCNAAQARTQPGKDGSWTLSAGCS